MGIEAVRELVSRLNNQAAALAVLGAALDARAGGTPIDSALARQVDEVLEAMGARAALDGATAPELAPVLAEIKTFWHLNTKLISGSGRKPGWSHTEPEILQGAGGVTTPFAHAFKRMLAPKLAGLVQRLETPGSAFLDIGCGVGLLSIEFARLWPALRVVGIDVWGPSLALARGQVAASGVADRIELREQASEHLPDSAAFDLAWMPVAFMPEPCIEPTYRNVARALKPGGWLLAATVKPGVEPLAAAVSRLRLASFGGVAAAPSQLEQALAGLGFTDVQTLPGPPNAPAAVIAARRGS